MHLDLAFKEGQTIKVNIRDVNKDKDKPTKPKSRLGNTIVLFNIINSVWIDVPNASI